jgi:hypothetical protein
MPSAIQTALESSKTCGILCFFNPFSHESHEEHIAKEAEMMCMKSESVAHEKSIIDEQKKALIHKDARL